MGITGIVRIGLVFGALAMAVPSAQACAGEGVVLAAGKAFTAASRSGSATAFLNAASRYADVRGIATSALGPHRNKLSKAQAAEYYRLAPAFMGKFMARYASRFNAAGMKVTTCSGSTITATTNGGRKIIFRISGGRVRDVNVGSVWLAGQMRSTFVGVINRNGGDVGALLDYLKG
jgi:ABC-type transporter MlaC component